VSSEVPIRWEPRRTDLSGNPAQRYLRLLVNVAKKCRGRGPPFGALNQEGKAGLVRAVDWFDPERGLRFSTYATWWICQGVQRGLCDRVRAIRLPLHEGETG
jgi:RNA polymerase sigma factor (sigma-70 family)